MDIKVQVLQDFDIPKMQIKITDFNGIGHDLMNKCVDYSLLEFGNGMITISAQKHLEKYYGSHDFTSTGKEYLEDGIPHVEMTYTPKN